MLSLKQRNNNVLDLIIETLGLKNDAQLSRTLNIQPPSISRMRTGSLEIGATNLIRMHTATKIEMNHLITLSGYSKHIK